MTRPIPLSTALSEQHALNAIATGVAAARSTDLFVNDAKGWTLALSVTNSSKAVPANARVLAFWADVDFRWRLNTAADLTDGAYARANDIITITIDPEDPEIVVDSIQAILSSGTGTMTGNWIFGA